MKRIAVRHKHVSASACAALLLPLLAACSDLPVNPELRTEEPSRQAPLVLQPGGLYCTEPEARLSSGAPFSVCFDSARWNRDIVVFIPGYHDPARAPSLPDNFAETPVSLLFSALGYAFATTGFRGTGLIQPETWIGGDLLELVETARARLVNTTGRTTRYIYQTGGSQGGLGTVKAIEQYPNTFSGGLAACGPIGDYQRQIDYVADFRVVSDYFLKDVIPHWPVWKQDLSVGDPGHVDPSSWGTAERTADSALGDPGNAERIRQVLAVTHVPSEPGSIKASILGGLWYSFRGTNDAIAKLGGMAFGNLDRRYSGSLDDDALNAGVQRFRYTGEAARLATLQTSARLRRPLVTIHTTGDPIVPVWHQSLYRSRLSFFDRLVRHTPFTISRYGHCKFTDAEVLAAFAVLVLKVSGENLLVSSDVLPHPQAQADFLRLSRDHGASPTLTR
jgi:hypothetical protein